MMYFIIPATLLTFVIFFWWALHRAKSEGYKQALNDVEAQAAKAGLAQVQKVYEAQKEVKAEHETIRNVLADTWPDGGVIELRTKGASLANTLTSADLQLDRG